MTTITVDEAIHTLNTMVEADRAAMANLIGKHVPCNHALAFHPTVQLWGDEEVVGEEGDFWVGMLGILNGIFGVAGDQWGFIAAEFDEDGHLARFLRTPEFRGS